MKIISGIFGVIILALVLCFALSNRQSVDVAMWPLTEALQVPFYLVALAPLAFGLIFGGAFGWASGMPHRLRVRKLKKELRAMNDKVDEMRGGAVIQTMPVARKKYFWESKT